MIQRWISECTTSHEACRSATHTRLPARLIDIGDGNDQAPRLVITSAIHEGDRSKLKYTALSYCWGSKTELDRAPYLRTTHVTLEEYMHTIPLEKLPKTILDAMTLTRRLGIRYLWADSLCILQPEEVGDAKATKDWEKQSSEMADVYGGAWLTIAASWGKSMHDGIFISRQAEPSSGCTISLASLQDPEQSGLISLAPSDVSTFVDSIEQPLYSRSWALQERVLSTRILICNRDQLVWECQSTCITESGFRMRSIGAMRLDHEFLVKAKAEPAAVYDTWRCLVSDYCLKSISNPSDKLPAIAGVARRLHELNNDKYIAGLWRGSILDDLLWAHKPAEIYADQGHSWSYREYRVKNKLEPCARGKPQTYIAPSWSWASTTGGVRWPYAKRTDDSHKYWSTIVEHIVKPRGEDSFGQVVAGLLIIKGPLWKIPDYLKSRLLSAQAEENLSFDVSDDYWWTRYASLDVPKEGSSLQDSLGAEQIAQLDFFFLRIRDDAHLILSSKARGATGASWNNDTRIYERIGSTEYHEYDPSHSKAKFKITTCKII